MATTPTLQLLIADDDPTVRDLLSRAFRQDFTVLLATDGTEAMAALKSTKPDAILVDEMMPGATGSEVLRVAKELLPEVPRLLMTASSDPTAAMRAVNHGEIHRFYTKPLRVMEVRRAISELVDRARGETALRAELTALRTAQAAPSTTATRVGVLCGGEIGELIVNASKRRGFTVARANSIDTLSQQIGAGGIDVVVVDVGIGPAALHEIVSLARGVDEGTAVVLVDDDEARTIATLTQAFQLGAVDCLVAPWPDELLLSVRLERAAARPRERRDLRRLTYDLVVANRDLALANRRVEEGQVKLLGGLVRALEARDPYTAGHTDRVASISVRCCEALSLPTATIEIVRVGALLHDIGKIGIRDEVLYKPGRLTPEEFEVIKTHTVIGARILDGIESLECVVPIVRGHHERPDGKGYPDGISASQLGIEVRVVSGADVLDAITSTRPYRSASGVDEAFDILTSLQGHQLDENVVMALRDLHRAGRLEDLLLQR
ncbi:MAG TPA: HD domain-containing phosphohydrolase [Myxococcota bacterium]